MSGLVVIIGSSDLTKRVAEVINARFPEVSFITPRRKPRWRQLVQRIKRRGLVTAAGQVCFRAVLQRIQEKSQSRIDAIWQDATFARKELDERQISFVSDVNASQVAALLKEADPEAVFVFGVPRLNEKTLSATTAPFINLHPGYAPFYRGVHTAYWALANNEADRFGVTVHYVDKGLDTGPIIHRLTSAPLAIDNASTYNHVLCVAALPSVFDAIARTLSGERIETLHSEPPAPVFLEPTIWQYFWSLVTKKIR